jgi:hypothetical protein
LLKINKLQRFHDESLKGKEIEEIWNRVSNADLVIGILIADQMERRLPSSFTIHPSYLRMQKY